MKPLQLITYPPKNGFYTRGHITYSDWQVDAWLVPDKRLTDAELAAEYWRASEIEAEHRLHRLRYGNPHGYNLTKKLLHEAHVLFRFATHPHHDEEQA